MTSTIDLLVRAVVIGTGATAFLDLWSTARQRLFGVPAPDYGLVGRWFGHMRHGRFHHDAIATAPSASDERIIGWVAHYAIGVAFAVVLLYAWGDAWACRPSIVPAMIVGVGSVAAPFLVMQPAMGAGVAASRTPSPATARVRSLVTHTVFGLGLYVAAWGASLVDVLHAGSCA